MGVIIDLSFRYDEDEARVNRDAQERSRAALQRYLFYCNRYCSLQCCSGSVRYKMIRIRNTAVDYPDPQQAVQRDRKSERNKALMVMDLRYKKKK